jgi:hypothetical protein
MICLQWLSHPGVTETLAADSTSSMYQLSREPIPKLLDQSAEQAENAPSSKETPKISYLLRPHIEMIEEKRAI